nr:hypothetical protein [Tanacetum cinerariifolium]
MANPNPEDPNVPNEGVPEEDPRHLLDYDEEEDPEMDAEERIMPQKPMSEARMREIIQDDDAEIISPYEVQGDQTLSPRDESSDSEPETEEADDEPEAEDADDELEDEEAGVEPEAEGADVELEAEEPDGVPEAVIGAGSQRPFAIRDFPIGVYEIGESFTARDPQFVGGLAPWALRRDLEALRGSGGTGGNADGTGVRAMGIEAANNTPWSEVKKWMTEEFCPRSVIQRIEQELYNLRMNGMDIDGYTNRLHELALLYPRMVEPEAVKVEQYIRGLAKSIRGDVTSSQPATINGAVRLAYQLAGQLIQDKADEATEGEKRKG